MKATTVRLDDHLLQQVDGIAKSLSRPRSWVIKLALERFVNYEEWFKQEVTAGISEVERGEVASHEELTQAFKKWGVLAA